MRSSFIRQKQNQIPSPQTNKKKRTTTKTEQTKTNTQQQTTRSKLRYDLINIEKHNSNGQKQNKKNGTSKITLRREMVLHFTYQMYFFAQIFNKSWRLIVDSPFIN